MRIGAALTLAAIAAAGITACALNRPSRTEDRGLVGRIVDSTGVRGISGVRITWMNDGRAVISSKGGGFRLPGLAPEPSEVLITFVDYDSVRVPRLSIAAGDSIILNAAIQPREKPQPYVPEPASPDWFDIHPGLRWPAVPLVAINDIPIVDGRPADLSHEHVSVVSFLAGRLAVLKFGSAAWKGVFEVTARH